MEEQAFEAESTHVQSMGSLGTACLEQSRGEAWLGVSDS